MNGAVLKMRLGYTSSEVAGQLIFCVVSFYLLKYYTDVLGISAAAAGTILLLARSIDAIDAPVWGIIFEKTHSRWGKSRPWFLWLSFPFALFGVLTFCTPPWTGTAKVIYAAMTYIACSVLYTGINTPVTSILSSLTPNAHERITLTSFRMFGSKFGVLLVNLSLFKLVSWLGHGDDRRGFMIVMPIYACGSLLLYLNAFRSLKETVVEEKRPVHIGQSFSALKGNGPWLIIFLSSFCFWIAFVARISSAPYFFEYVLQRKDLVGLANSLDAVSLLSILFLPLMCRHISKRTLWIASLLTSVASQVVVYAGAKNHSVGWAMTGWGLGFLTSGIALALPFSILSDSVDYGEWKSGIRAAGLLTAIGAAFCLKAGGGLGGALPAWILQWSSYVPNAVQTQRAIYGILWSCIWLPAVSYALAAIPVFFYHRYERLEPTIRRELEDRRAIAATLASTV